MGELVLLASNALWSRFNVELSGETLRMNRKDTKTSRGDIHICIFREAGEANQMDAPLALDFRPQLTMAAHYLF